VDLKSLQGLDPNKKKGLDQGRFGKPKLLECLTVILALVPNKSGRNTAYPRISHRVGITQVRSIVAGLNLNF
jgi:hypothetical protein